MFDVTIPAQTPIGLHVVRVLTEQGLSLPIPFLVDDLPVVARAEAIRHLPRPRR